MGTEEKFDFINIVHVGNTKNATLQTGYTIRAKIAVGTVWGDDETKLLKITVIIHNYPKFVDYLFICLPPADFASIAKKHS